MIFFVLKKLALASVHFGGLVFIMLSWLFLTLCVVVQRANAGARIDVPVRTNQTIGEAAPETTYFHTTLPAETRLALNNAYDTETDDSFSFDTLMYVMLAALLVVTVGCLRGCKYYADLRKKEWDLEQEKSRQMALAREKMEKRTSKAHTAHSPNPSYTADSTSSGSAMSLHGAISSASSMSFESDCQLAVF